MLCLSVSLLLLLLLLIRLLLQSVWSGNASNLCLIRTPDFFDGQDSQPWDLRCEDIELESTIAAGGAGSVIAATYNGFDVAVKVRQAVCRRAC